MLTVRQLLDLLAAADPEVRVWVQPAGAPEGEQLRPVTGLNILGDVVRTPRAAEGDVLIRFLPPT